MLPGKAGHRLARLYHIRIDGAGTILLDDSMLSAMAEWKSAQAVEPLERHRADTRHARGEQFDAGFMHPKTSRAGGRAMRSATDWKGTPCTSCATRSPHWQKGLDLIVWPTFGTPVPLETKIASHL